jgi:hypothetical protein
VRSGSGVLAGHDLHGMGQAEGCCGGHGRRGTDAVLRRVLAGVLLPGELVQLGEHPVAGNVTGNLPVQGVGDDTARDRAQVGQRGNGRLRDGRVEPEAGGVTVNELVDDLLGGQDRVTGRHLQGRAPGEVGPAALVAAPAGPLVFSRQGDRGLAVARGRRQVALAGPEAGDAVARGAGIGQQPLVRGAGKAPGQAPADLPAPAGIRQAARAVTRSAATAPQGTEADRRLAWSIMMARPS